MNEKWNMEYGEGDTKAGVQCQKKGKFSKFV